ncbi:SURF1 family protein [Luedemannella helvata]
MLLAAAVMVGLGQWQLSRYEQRSAINDSIDAGGRATPVALASPPQPSWTRVTVTGRYDTANEVLARGRTVDGKVGFEVVTPLVRADGTAVLIDRGWVPAPTTGGAAALPAVPAAPAGEVTVTGRVHAPESRSSAPTRGSGPWEVRRIAPERIGTVLPYPVEPVYVTMDPPADGFVAIKPARQNATLNAAYAGQWWIFAVLTLVGFGYLARREARARADADPRSRARGEVDRLTLADEAEAAARSA